MPYSPPESPFQCAGGFPCWCLQRTTRRAGKPFRNTSWGNSQETKEIGIELTRYENSLYGAIQGTFNARPELAMTLSNSLIVYEAKYTQPFDDAQLKRTKTSEKCGVSCCIEI